MATIYSRTEKLLGQESIDRLKSASVIIFGLGGVGSYAVEALARVGVGRLAIVDDDKIEITNLNRQLVALHSTLGKKKTTVTAQRLKDINKDITVEEFSLFYDKNTADNIMLEDYDYIIDAIDSVSSKLLLIATAYRLRVPIISCMGTGNKLNPLSFKVADISKTTNCPLAKVIRHELRKREIPSLKVVYSTEKSVIKDREISSISYIPAIAGLLLASAVINDIVKKNDI